MRTALKNFYNLLKLDRTEIYAIYILAILAGLVQLSLPLGIQTVISFVMAGSVSTSIVVLIILVVLGTFVDGLLQVRQLQVLEKLKQGIFLRYAFEFAGRLPKLNVEKLDKYYLPEVVNRFFDTVSLQKGLEKLLLDLPAAVIQVFLGLILLAFYHPVFIGFGVLLLTIVVLIMVFTMPRGFSLALQSSEYKYSIAAWLQEVARMVKSFKYIKSGSLHLSKTDELACGYVESRTKYFKVLLVQFWSLTSFKIVITASMLIVGTILLVNQQINIGQFIASDIIILAIINSVEKIVLSLDKVYDALVSIKKLDKIAEAEEEASGEILLDAEEEGLDIQFNNVAFSYPGAGAVLSQLTLRILPGQMALIHGRSGAGKSTLLRLLTGAYSNYSGSIMVNSLAVNNYNLDSLRAATGVMLSSQDIFYGSLLENITMGNANVTIKEVNHLAEKLNLLPFIQAQKEGLYSQLYPGGKKLPGNTRQKILLIRALLGYHRLLLLEEPFAYLDGADRTALIALLRQLKNTTIIITSEDSGLAGLFDISFHITAVQNK